MRKPRKPRMPLLPLDIIECEILPRLPAKSSARFKCVCKQWNLFLLTDEFENMNLHHQTIDESRTHHKLLFINYSPPSTFSTFDFESPNHCPPNISRPFPFVNRPNEVYFLATLNGLVCVTLYSTKELVIWNPLTSAYKKVTRENNFYNNYIDSLGFYMDSSADYRLLHLCFEGAYIYSRRLDSWRKIDFLDNGYRYPIDNYWWSPGIFLGESLYFMVNYKYIEDQSGIIIFDVNSEKFREIRFPCITNGVDYCGRLMVINGCIHLCVTYMSVVCQMVRRSLVEFESILWRLDCDGWIKMFAFSSKQSDKFSISHMCENICEKMNEKLFAIAMLKDGSFHEIGLKEFTTSNLFWYLHSLTCKSRNEFVMFVETLVSPSS